MLFVAERRKRVFVCLGEIIYVKGIKCKKENRKALAISLNTLSDRQGLRWGMFLRLFFSFLFKIVVRSKINSIGVRVNFIKGLLNLLIKNEIRWEGFIKTEFNDEKYDSSKDKLF